MTLTVCFSKNRDAAKGQIFPVRESTLYRELGHPTRWVFSILVRPENRSVEDMPELATMLESGPVYARLMWKEIALSIAGIVVGLQYNDQADNVSARSILDVEAHLTWPEQENPDPFQPRSRVHRVKKFHELLDIFEPVVKTTKSVRNKLLEIEFKDAEHAAVIQDGLSDWDFIFYALNQFFQLQQDQNLKPLVISGSLDKQNQSEGCWLINWGSSTAYESLGDKKSRTIESKNIGGIEQLFFSQQTGYRRPMHPNGVAPAVIHQHIAREKESFEPKKYQDWISQDLPQFLDKNGAMVWKIEDQLRAVSKPGRASWTSRLYTNLVGVPVLGQQHSMTETCLRPWYGFGEVVKSSEKGPWITVRLVGFEEKENQLDVRLTTGYSGTDGCKGIHTVPEQGTQVYLGWTGRFGDSIVCLANVREEPAELASPSLWLEKKALVRTDEIEAQDIGHITIQSDLSVSLDQTSEIKGAASMELDVDGTEVKLAGGIFHTGKA